MENATFSPTSDITDENVTSDVTTSPMTQGGRSLYTLPPRELHYYHVIYLSVAIALGVPGNALVVTAYGSVRRKTSCDWYILYIAVLDLIICLFRVPTHLAMETGNWQHRGTDALCKFVYWLSHSVITASVVLFGFIAVDRYIKVCKPVTRISSRFSRNCILVISVCSLLSATPTVWMYANDARGKCVVSTLLGMELMRYYYTILFAIFVMMFLVVVVCYTFIVVKVKKSRLTLKAHQEQDRTTEFQSKKRKTGWKLVRVGASSGLNGDSAGYPYSTTKASATGGASPETSRMSSSEIFAVANQLRNPGKKSSEGLSFLKVKRPPVSLIRVAPLSSEKLFVPRLDARPPTTGSDVRRNANNASLSCGSIGHEGESSKRHSQNTKLKKTDAETGKAEGKNGERDLDFSSNDSDEISSESQTTKHSENQDALSFDQNMIRHNHMERNLSTEQPSTVEIKQISKQPIEVSEATKHTTTSASTSVQQNDTTALKGDKRANDLTETKTNLAQMSQHKHTKKHQMSENHINRPGCSHDKHNLGHGGDRKKLLIKQNSPAIIPTPSREVSDRQKSDVDTDERITQPRGQSKTQSETRNRPGQWASRSVRLTLLLLMVTVVFVISWIPPYVAMVWYFYVGYTPPLSSADIALQKYAPTGYVLNHFANPILYLIFSSSFRETLAGTWKLMTGRRTR